MDGLRKVPAQLKTAVPEEVAAPAQGERGVVELLHVALLEFIVGTRDVGVEGNVLRQVVEALVFHNLQPLRLALHFAERLEGLEVGRPGVVEGILPRLVFLPRRGLSRRVANGIR